MTEYRDDPPDDPPQAGAMYDPDFEPKPASISREKWEGWQRDREAAQAKDKRQRGASAGLAVVVLLMIGGIIGLIVASRSKQDAAPVPAPTPAPVRAVTPFPETFETKLVVGADGNSGYLMTEDGHLYHLNGTQAEEVKPLPASTQPAAR